MIMVCVDMSLGHVAHKQTNKQKTNKNNKVHIEIEGRGMLHKLTRASHLISLIDFID